MHGFLGFREKILRGPRSVSNPGYPEHETRFFGFFLLPETRVFSTTKTRVFKKKLELLLHSNISNSDNIEVAD